MIDIRAEGIAFVVGYPGYVECASVDGKTLVVGDGKDGFSV